MPYSLYTMPFLTSRYPFAVGKTVKPACSAAVTENGWFEPEAGVEVGVEAGVEEGVEAGVEAEAWPEAEAVWLDWLGLETEGLAELCVVACG